MATRTLTIVFTDIKGFTERTSSSSRAALNELLDQHENLLLPVIHHYDGTVVKTIGDAFLLTFESPTNAVLCGLMIQETLREFNANAAPEQRIEVRVAINTGEVEVRGGDVFGETVNIAARIEGITDPGEVYFTHATYLSMNKSEVPTSEVGERRLKGIDEPIRVYRVIRDQSLESYQSLIAAERSHQLDEISSDAVVSQATTKKRTGLILILAGLCAGAALLAFFGPRWYAGFQAHREIDRLSHQIKAADTGHDIDAAYDRLNDLAEDRPRDLELLRKTALLNGANPYWRKYSFSQIKTLVDSDPALLGDKQLADLMWQSLAYLDPDDDTPGANDSRIRHFLTTTFAPLWRERLLTLIHGLETDQRRERRNAYLIVKQSSFANDIDRLRYFTGELWSEVNTDTPWNKRVFEYLESYMQQINDSPSTAPWIPEQTLPSYLNYFNDEADRAVKIVQNLYALPLRDPIERVVGEADTGPRLHGWQILTQRGWDTPALERAYQLANLNDYWKGYTANWVVDSLRYFAAQDPITVTPETAKQIRRIANETRVIVEGGKLPDARQTVDDYQRRLQAAEAAIAALGKP